MPTPNKNLLIQVEQYAALALMLPVATLVGYAMGYGLDHLFGTKFLRMVFLLVGVASGFTQIVRQLVRESKRDGS